MVAMTVPALLMGIAVSRATKQRLAVQAIQRQGGGVLYLDEVDPAATTLPFPDWFRNLLGEDYFRTVAGVMLRPSPALQSPREALAQLANLPHLETLALGCEIKDDDLRYLRTLGKLTRLGLDNAHLTDDGLRHLSVLTRLEGLWICRDSPHGPIISDRGLVHLKHLKLHDLVIEPARITDRGMAELADLSELDSLSLTFSPDATAELSWLDRCPKLHLIEWKDITIGRRGWQALAGCRQLEIAWFRNSKLDDDGIRELAALPKLFFLELHDSSINGPGLQALARVDCLGVRNCIVGGGSGLTFPRSLLSLDLNGMPVDEGMLAELNALPKLHNLTLIDVAIEDATLDRLQPPQLKSLYLDRCVVTPAAIAAFEARTGIRVVVRSPRTLTSQSPLAVP